MMSCAVRVFLPMVFDALWHGDRRIVGPRHCLSLRNVGSRYANVTFIDVIPCLFIATRIELAYISAVVSLMISLRCCLKNSRMCSSSDSACKKRSRTSAACKRWREWPFLPGNPSS